MPDAESQALKAIHDNIQSTDKGEFFLAAPIDIDNYFSLWTRDSMITTLAVAQIEQTDLHNIALNCIAQLKEHQNPLGRIPAYIHLKDNYVAEFGGWGRIETLDSQMWYIIGAAAMALQTNHTHLISDDYLHTYKNALKLLEYRTEACNPNNLVDWPASSGWDDQMLRRHHVLSLESLRIIALQSYAKLLEAAGQTQDISSIEQQIQHLQHKCRHNFWITPERADRIFSNTSEDGSGYFSAYKDQIIEYMQTNDTRYFTSYLTPYEISTDHIKRFDTYGNLLAILAGIATPEQTNTILNYIQDKQIDQPYPLKVLDPPIEPQDRDYHPFYDFGKNQAYHYHNGGLWPHISALYVRVLYKAGRPQQAQQATQILQNLVLQPGEKYPYSFSEYYPGDTGKPDPIAHEHQCWSAASLFLATKKPLIQENIL